MASWAIAVQKEGGEAGCERDSGSVGKPDGSECALRLKEKESMLGGKRLSAIEFKKTQPGTPKERGEKTNKTGTPPWCAVAKVCRSIEERERMRLRGKKHRKQKKKTFFRQRVEGRQ